MKAVRAILAVTAAAAVPALPAAAQGYRARVDLRYQAASYRGVVLDSLPASAVVTPPGSGPVSPDGFAVDCAGGSGYCFYFRPGEKVTGQPVTASFDATAWGFGVQGLTMRLSGRLAGDLGERRYPGSQPGAVLTEGYVEYLRGSLAGRLGRQVVQGRLGWQGFDGARATVRFGGAGLEVSGYGGWGLSRALAVPVTSPALNPLDDFQPRDRQLVAGVEGAFRRGAVDLTAEYRREVDPAVDYFVSERAAWSAAFRPLSRIVIAGGAEYDFANGWWGSADASVRWQGPRLVATAEARRYRPFFDLWTIWGAFSPVPWQGLRGSVAAQPVAGLWLRAHGERFWFDDAEADTPLADAEDRGWRAGLSATVALGSRWLVESGLRGEFGAGAASRTVDGALSYRAGDGVLLSARAGRLDRPLEFRFSDARLDWVSLGADVDLGRQLRLVADAGWFGEARNRPDAAAFDLDQFRVSTRLVVSFGGAADRLPKGRPRPAGSAAGGTH